MTVPREAALLGYAEPRGRRVLAATVLGSSMAFLDATVVNIALPAIADELGGDAVSLTWTVNAYTLTLAAFVLVGGSLGDRYGRRRIFVVGTVCFGLASLACAMAGSIELLVLFRGLQGVGAALLTPGALAILQASFRPEDRSRAIGAWSGLTGIATAVGPFLGGVLVDQGSWRWIFLLNVPVLVAVVVLSARHVPESRDPASTGGLDLAGAGLAATGLGALTYGLSVWSTPGAGAGEAGLTVALGVVAGIGFVLWERRAAAPMLPLGILAAPRLAATNLVTFLMYAALGGVFFWLVVTLQVVAGWSALEAGLSLLPVTVLMLLFSPRAGAWGDRLGPRVMLTAGPLIAAAGVGLLSLVTDDAGWSDVAAPVTLLGAGLAVSVAPLTTTVLAAAGEERAGLASGLNNAVARTGGLVLVALLPALTRLGPTGFSDPPALARAFPVAMLICSVLLAAAGVVAAVTLRTAGEARPRSGAAAPQRHCAVDGPPWGVTCASGGGRGQQS